MITIEPHSGLANRMRAIASAVWVAQQLSSNTLKIVWNVNSEVCCPFEVLFNPDSRYEIIGKPKKNNYLKTSLQENSVKRKVASIINKLLGQDFVIRDQDFKKYFWNNKINFIDLVERYNNVYLHTCEELSNIIPLSNVFKPKSEIQDIINCQLSYFNENTIGLHIRRTDNIWAIKNSPVELFIEKIKETLNENNSANFFLATDDYETESLLKNYFGSRIYTFRKEFSRQSEQGIKDALVEMFCLASTQKIYGSYWSSFSNVASRLKNIPLEILRIQDFN